VEFTDTERATLLRALFELWVTLSAFDDDPDGNVIPLVATIPRERIEALVRRLGGDPDAPMFGAESLPVRQRPLTTKLCGHFIFEVLAEPVADFGSVLVSVHRDRVLQRSVEHFTLGPSDRECAPGFAWKVSTVGNHSRTHTRVSRFDGTSLG